MLKVRPKKAEKKIMENEFDLLWRSTMLTKFYLEAFVCKWGGCKSDEDVKTLTTSKLEKKKKPSMLKSSHSRKAIILKTNARRSRE